MDKIKSLNKLIEILKQSDPSNYVKVAKRIVIPPSDFSPYCNFKEDGYARNCVIKTEEFELILICWKKDDITPIHGHDNKQCWVYLVEGEMTEIRYEQNDSGDLIEKNRMNLTKGKLTYMEDSMGYHMLENPTEENSMSLHLYMKPVESCQVYNDNTNCFEEMDLAFHSIKGELVEELI
jgi:cysteine dioxygenase